MRAILCLLVAGCLANMAWAGYDEGVAAHRRGDYATALRELRPGAEAGEARSQRGLAFLYEYGQGVPKDLDAALSWYLKAALQGDTYAQYRVGLIHEEGRGVPRSMPRALEWYEKAAAGGSAEAQSQLGWLYLSGTGVARDVRQGAEWTRKAAAQGDAVGQLNLGWMYHDGLGVAADPKAALQWYRKSAEQGNAIAQRNVGLMLQAGRGAPADPVAAKAWFEKAAAQGDEGARQALAAARDGARPPGTPPRERAAAAAAQPTGKLSLLCQLQSGQSYVFVVDERAQQVGVRDSTGQDWVIFQRGQSVKQRFADQWVAMVDSVQVDAAAIRVLREPREEAAGKAPNVSSNPQTNELVGLLGNLLGAVATSSSVVIDRNSGVIRTGGMGLFPNNGSGICEPWSGRRF